MKKIILIFSALFFVVSCVSTNSESRKPTGLFDFLFGNKNEGLTLMKCENCKTPFADPGTIQLEDEKSCPADRLYYQSDFNKISNTYKLKRENFSEAEFPDACVAYIMRSFGGYEEESKYVAHCSSDDTAPVRNKKMVCVTPEYAYSTYNAFVDVMDCLSIPQKELLPKLWNESHFHVNTYGAGDDAGVGQLTGDAIKEVIRSKYADSDVTELEYYRREMEKSNKPSCQRILAEPSAWKLVSSDVSKRCGIMKPESSPLRNILYTGIFYRVITERLAGIYYRSGQEMVRGPSGLIERTDNTPLGGAIQKLQIREKMETLGIQNPSSDYLKQVMVTLAFNAGTRTSAHLFDDFLKARIANNMSLTEEDLDFINADSSAEIALVNVPAGETPEARIEREAKLNKARETSYQRKLPQFLRLMQIKGAPGYVSKVGFRSKKLNNEVGADICTQKFFLQHSSAAKQ